MTKILRTIVLEGERPPSNNVFYEARHWSRRAQIAKRVHALVRSSLDPADRPYEHPVAIRVVAYFKNRPQDSCNICAKVYTDGLLALGDWQDGFRSLLWDDDMRYVTETRLVPRVDKERPRVEIEILEVEDE